MIRIAAMQRAAAYELPLVDVVRGRGDDEGDPLIFETVRGHINARYHAVRGGGADRGVIWLPGADGGLGGPSGLYPELARRLLAQGIESLRLGWRRPNRIEEGVRDALVGVHWLVRERGLDRLAVVGHAFGGAVAIRAGVIAPEVVAVATLAAHTSGIDPAALTKPLFVAQGEADPALPTACARWLAMHAGAGAECRIYSAAGHDLAAARQAVAADLVEWLAHALSG